jgi:hypothetical protein
MTGRRMTPAQSAAMSHCLAAHSAKNKPTRQGLPIHHAGSTSERNTMLGTFGPIEQEPRRVRPPYNVRDEEAQGRWFGVETEDEWRNRLHGDRLAAMLEPLAGMDVSPYERQILGWLSDWETGTVAVVAALLHRARAAYPLATGGHHPLAGDLG